MSNTMPQINIVFSQAAQTVQARSGRGSVGLIIRDAAASKGMTLLSADEIPGGLSADNKAYVARTFLGADGVRPQRVYLYVLSTGGDLSEALAWMALQNVSWLALPLDASEADCTEVKTWLEAQRSENNAVYKAVLPNTASNYERVVNFAASGIVTASGTYAAAAYCSRIAGILAALPLTQSATYAVLEEVTDVDRMTKASMDEAVAAGKLILHHDGSRVKLGRAVNSLTTIPAGESEDLQHIRILEIRDTVESDLRQLVADEYIGKFTNTYENKLVLVAAIQDYLLGLESQGILAEGSTVELDIAAMRQYLIGKNVDVSSMTDLQILKANTGTQVFVKVRLSIVGAIEDIAIIINL